MNGPTFATPRTTATMPLTRPAPAKPSKPGVKLDADGGNALRVLTYLRLHWLMILFCGSMLGTGLAYAAWELMPSKFESYGLFQVSSAPTQIANQNNPNQARTDFTTALKTNAALMKSEFVLNAALRDMRDVQIIKQQKEPIRYLEEEVQVNWQEGSEVIRVTYKSDRPGDAKKVVDAIQSAFISEVIMKEVQEKQVFLNKVEEAKLDMVKLLESRAKPAGKSAVIPVGGQVPPVNNVTPAGGAVPGVLAIPGGAEPLAPLGVAPPVAAASPAGALADEMLRKLDPRSILVDLASLRREVERAPLQIDDAKRRIESVRARIDLVHRSPPDATVIQAVEKDEDVLRMRQKAEAAKRKYDLMAGSGDPNAPGVIRLRNDWQAEEHALEKHKKEKVQLAENIRRADELKKLTAEGDVAFRDYRKLEDQQKIALAQLSKTEKMIREIKIPEVTQAGSHESKEESYSPIATIMKSDDGILASLAKQYMLTRMELQSPPRVRTLQKASQPSQKDLKKQIIATVAAGLMGFALMALGVIAYETVSRKVSSLADLKSAGPAPVVGVIPCIPSEATGRDPAKRAAANEAIDKLRSYVTQTWFSRGATTVAVTSAIGDEGKAFTAFGLASSLAQSGYKTLLVDFDLRTPTLHAYAGLPNTNGVCEVLRGEVDAVQSIQHLPSGLNLLPSGRWSDEARKAAVGGKLEMLLTRLKEPFDCVVLHGHALLTAAESVEVARRCDVVLVCALYRETKAPLLRKATDRVATMEIPYSGVVYIGASESEALC